MRNTALSLAIAPFLLVSAALRGDVAAQPVDPAVASAEPDDPIVADLVATPDVDEVSLSNAVVIAAAAARASEEVRVAAAAEERAEIMKEAVVTVEGIELGRLTDNEAGEEAIAEFPLPESLRQNPFLRITIGRGNQKITPHIYEVRLVE